MYIEVINRRMIVVAIRFIDGSCGSGKTEAYIKYIKKFSTDKVMIVVETISLCNEIKDRCNKVGITSDKITSEMNWKLMPDGKKKKIDENITTLGLFYKSLDSECEVWIITWSTYKMIDSDTLSKFQDIFIDDIRQITDFIKFVDLAENSYVITNLFKIVGEYSVPNLRKQRNEELGKQTKVSDTFEYYELEFSENMDYLGKSVYGYFRDNLRKLYYSSKSHYIYVNKHLWDNIINEKFDYSDKDASNENNSLNFYLSPMIDVLFPYNCTIVGEGLFDGELCQGNNEITSILLNRGYDKFKPHHASKYLKKLDKNENHHARIKYCSEDRMSRYKLNKQYDEEINTLQHISKITDNYFKSLNKNYIYIANLDYKDSDKFLSGKKIQTINRGLNLFSSYEGVACLTAMSLSYKDQDLKWHIDKISPEQDRLNGQMSNELQTIMRTSLRNKIGDINMFESDTYTDIVLMDIDSANFISNKLKDIFNVSCELIENGILKVNKVSTRRKRFENMIESLMMIENDLKSELNQSNIIVGLLGNIYNKAKNISYQCFDDFFVFRKQMKKFYTTNIIESKKDNLLLTNTVFKRNDEESKRDLNNVHFSNMVVLDFDDSSIDGKNMASILRQLKYSGFVYSTSSNENGISNRYRAILEVKNNIRMTSELYKRVCQHVMQKVEGVVGHKIGLDQSKFTTTSLFYMPCRLIGKEEQSFFYNLSDKRENYGIDISLIIDEMADEEVVEYETSSSEDKFESINKSNIEKVLSGKYREHFGVHERHLKLVSCLHSHGFSALEISTHIPNICTNLGSYKKTLKSIEKICKNNKHISMGWLNNEIKKLEGRA